MRLTGFDSFEFEPNGYACSVPLDWYPTPNISPVVLPRPGTYATLGIGSVTEMVIPGQFLYFGTALTFEEAWFRLYKRLDAVNTLPRQLRAEKNDGTKMAILAMVQPLAISRDGEHNTRDVNFIAVQPYFEELAASTATGTF